MRPIGYMYKRVLPTSQWLNAPEVVDIYSVSGCVSEYFADYVPFWRHNGFWLFDSPEIIQSLAKEHSIPLQGLTLFYYTDHEQVFDDTTNMWLPIEADESFETNVRLPAAATLEGFDVTAFGGNAMPGCSPLSCNHLAAEIATNSHCLFPTFEDAIGALQEGKFKQGESGPFRIIGVYSVNDA